MNPSSPTFELIARLERVAQSQNWIGRAQYENIREAALAALSQLSQEEQGLVFTLLQDFIWIPLTQYEVHLQFLAKAILEQLPDKANELFIVPLVPSKSKQGPPKSGDFVAYIITQLLKSHASVDLNIQLLGPIASVDPKRLHGRSQVVFVDDYIGTGDTAVQTANEFPYDFTERDTHPIMACIAIQSEGLSRLKERQLSVIYSIVINKGITDSQSISDKSHATALMTNIEERLAVSKDYQFGYKRSEALISLIKTPNNTFPFFWWKVKNQSWKPIFPRN